MRCRAGSLERAPARRHREEVIAILPDFEEPIGTFDGHQVGHIIETGTRAAEEQVPYLRRLACQA